MLPLVFYEVQLAVPTDISSKSDPLGLSSTTKCVDELMDLQGYNIRPASSFFLLDQWRRSAENVGSQKQCLNGGGYGIGWPLPPREPGVAPLDNF